MDKRTVPKEMFMLELFQIMEKNGILNMLYRAVLKQRNQNYVFSYKKHFQVFNCEFLYFNA